MKILKLRLKNINSIRGDYTIDFTAPEYASNSLFAILGPTGSGKTSILDGICLALFGETPRTGKRRSDVISHGEKESIAELTFAINGKEYIAFFGCKRKSDTNNHKQAEVEGDTNGKENSANSGSKKKSDTINHTLAELEGDTPTSMCRNTSEVTAWLKQPENLNLTFGQFCRVVLLAQGQFDAFLKAKAEERGDILEKISGTEKYSEIGARIHERYTVEDKELTQLSLSLDAHRILSDPAREAKEKELETVKSKQSSIKSELAELETLLGTYKEQQRLTVEQGRLSEAAAELTRERTEFEPSRLRLEAGQRVQVAQESCEAMKACAGEQKSKNDAWRELRGQNMTLHAKLEECVAAHAESKKSLDGARGQLALREPVLKAVEEQDRKIANARSVVNEKAKKYSECDGQCKEKEASLLEAKKAAAEIERKNQEAKAYVEAHSDDGKLSEQASNWERQLKQLKEDRQTLSDKEQQKKVKLKEIESSKAAVAGAERGLETSKTDLVTFNKKRESLQSDYSQLLGDRSLDSLKKDVDAQMEKVTFAKTALNYEEQRSLLKVGEPCPLCGSTEHPWSEDYDANPIVAKGEERLRELKKEYERAQKLHTELETLGAQLPDKEKLVDKAREQLEQATTTKSKLEADLSALTSELASCSEKVNHAEEALKAALGTYGFDWEAGSSSLPERAIKERVKAWNEAVAANVNAEAARQESKNSISGLEGALVALRENLESLRHEKDAADKAYSELIEERKRMYGDKNPADELKQLNDQVTACEKQERKAGDALTKVEQDKKNNEDSLVAAERHVVENERKLRDLSVAFLNVCYEHGFGANEYYACKLDASEILCLSTQDKELSVRLEEQARQQASNGQALAAVMKSLEGAVSQEEASALSDQKTEERDLLNQSLGTLEAELRSDDEARKQKGELQAKHDKQQAIADHWNMLDKWFGGQDGGRLKRLAQEYTMSQLFEKANERLKNLLGGRFQLCPSDVDSGNLLEIDVLDHDMGDDIRSSQNLSGGERFSVSLALALGMADMVGDHINVESLFIDEGFGSLDAQELESALELLHQIQDDGKTIGIITHAERLQERIPVRLQLTKLGNGSSKIEGPGVSHQLPQERTAPKSKGRRRKTKQEEA